MTLIHRIRPAEGHLRCGTGFSAIDRMRPTSIRGLGIVAGLVTFLFSALSCSDKAVEASAIGKSDVGRHAQLYALPTSEISKLRTSVFAETLQEKQLVDFVQIALMSVRQEGRQQVKEGRIEYPLVFEDDQVTGRFIVCPQQAPTYEKYRLEMSFSADAQSPLSALYTRDRLECEFALDRDALQYCTLLIQGRVPHKAMVYDYIREHGEIKTGAVVKMTGEGTKRFSC